MRGWPALTVFALALAAVWPGPGAAAELAQSLCIEAETVVFSCHIGVKTASLCQGDGPSRPMVYRFGRPGRIELTHRGGAPGTPAAFTRSARPLYGGGIESVHFSRGGFDYSVYARVGRAGAGGDPEFEDGITVTRQGRPAATRVCDDGGAGFRAPIDSLPQRPGE